jgi:hypothetical protein
MSSNNRGRLLVITILGLLFCVHSCNEQSIGEGEEIIFRDPDNGTVTDRLSIIDGVPLDMVLIYEGGTHRTIKWNKEHFAPYVSAQVDGKERWLFDGFLFLEIHDGKDRGFASGYREKPARKSEWEALLNGYFTPGNAICALDDQVGKVRDGKNMEGDFRKRKVVIAIPEPIPNQKDWGELDGRSLSFTNRSDRVAACQWYVDYAVKLFGNAKLKNLELTGFYWLAEEATHTRDMVKEVAGYLDKRGYDFYWIPYYFADGYFEWKELGFDVPYYQPNYFFNEDIPVSRIKEACLRAKRHGMNLEVEFDERALTGRGNWGYRLHHYLDVFESEAVLYKVHLAYYQGGDAFYRLAQSSNYQDGLLYQRLVNVIVERQKRLAAGE